MAAQERRESPSGSVVLYSSDRFLEHGTPAGHPERPERAAVMTAVARRWADSGGRVETPRPVSTEMLLAVHDRRHLDTVAATAGRRVQLDADTYASPSSEEIARLAAGATIGAVDHALGGGRGLAFVRPPGHHAERDRAMGFCLYNNVAVAAAHALGRGLSRVAIIDYDVHHGNGTQWMFYDDPRVLYVSLHQYPFYPGTGAAEDVGRGAGEGFTVNVPLEAGAGDVDYALVVDEVVGPILSAFAPEVLLLSAGYDAHDRDPLGGMYVTTDGYTAMTRRVRALADGCCDGRIAVVTEGGYDLEALDECLASTLAVMAQPLPSDAAGARAARGAAPRATRALEKVRAAQRPFWPAL